MGGGKRKKWKRGIAAALCVLLLLTAGLSACQAGGGKAMDGSTAAESGSLAEGSIYGEKIAVREREDGVSYVAEEAELTEREKADLARLNPLRSGALTGQQTAGDGKGQEPPEDGEGQQSAGDGAGQQLAWIDVSKAREVLRTGDYVLVGQASGPDVFMADELKEYDLQGNLMGNLDVKGKMVEGLGDGCYVLLSDGPKKSIWRIDLEKRELRDGILALPEDVRDVFLQGSDEEDLYFYTGEGCWRYSFAEKVFEHLFTWTDLGIYGSNVITAWMDADGVIRAEEIGWGAGGTKYYRIRRQETQEESPVKKLVVAVLTTGSDGNLQKFAVNFNKSQSEYHVSIRHYASDGAGFDPDDARARLNADLLGSDPPDLLCFGNLSGMDDYVANGYLMDLSPFLEASSVISKEDFYPEILALGTYGDGLYTIPYQFSMDTLLVPESQWKKAPGWTVGEMVSYLREHEEYQPLRWFLYLRLFLFQKTLDYFWDGETMESHFDSQEFRDYLSYLKECKDREESGRENEQKPVFYHLDYHFLRSYPDAVKECGENLTIMGYPSPDGKPRTILSGNSELAILSTSREPEGAFKFMESYLNADYPLADDVYSGFYLYSNQKVMNAMIEKEVSLYGKDHEDILDEEGNVIGAIYAEHAINREYADVFYEILGEAQRTPAGNEPVSMIVNEETMPYFEGQKTLDQTVDAIQSRVKLYLAEQKR